VKIESLGLIEAPTAGIGPDDPRRAAAKRTGRSDMSLRRHIDSNVATRRYHRLECRREVY